MDTLDLFIAMENSELILIKGGAFSANLLSNIVKAATTLYELGRALGTIIRRAKSRSYCKI